MVITFESARKRGQDKSRILQTNNNNLYGLDMVGKF